MLLEGFRDRWPDAWPDLATWPPRWRSRWAKTASASWLSSRCPAGWIGAIQTYDTPGSCTPSWSRGFRGRDRRALVERSRIGSPIGRRDDLSRDRRSGRFDHGLGIDLYPDPLRTCQDRGRPSVQFYRKLGYALVGIIPDANGPGQPDILMAKRIAPGTDQLASGRMADDPVHVPYEKRAAKFPSLRPNTSRLLAPIVPGRPRSPSRRPRRRRGRDPRGPFDWGTTFRPGARFGPAAIREADYGAMDGYRPHLPTGIDALGALGVVDIGDVYVVPGQVELSLDRITDTVEQVTKAGKIPIVLGGDHTITFANATGVARVHGFGEVALVHFDAHADTGEMQNGQLYGHGTPMRRLVESGAVPGHRFVQIGLQGLLARAARDGVDA